MPFRVRSIRVQGPITAQTREQLSRAANAPISADALVVDLLDAGECDDLVRELLAGMQARWPRVRFLTENDGKVCIHCGDDGSVSVLERLPRPTPTKIEGVEWEELVLSNSP